MRVFIKNVFWLLLKITYRIKISGKENIPKDGAVIICPNHIHALDAAVIVAFSKRKINVLAKEELFKGRFVKWLADLFGIYPIKRDSADMQAMKISLKVLKNQEPLMIFPEGTRNGLEKGVPVKNGAVVIAIKSGTPIIPVGIKGTFKIFSKITVNIGKPIYYDEYKENLKDKEIVSKLTEDLMKEIVKLRDK